MRKRAVLLCASRLPSHSPPTHDFFHIFSGPPPGPQNHLPKPHTNDACIAQTARRQVFSFVQAILCSSCRVCLHRACSPGGSQQSPLVIVCTYKTGQVCFWVLVAQSWVGCQHSDRAAGPEMAAPAAKAARGALPSRIAPAPVAYTVLRTPSWDACVTSHHRHPPRPPHLRRMC